MEQTDKEGLTFRMRCVEDYTLESYAEVEDGKVVQKSPESVDKAPIDVHEYEILGWQGDQPLGIITQLRDMDVAMKLLILLDEGIWTLDDLDDYTHGEILDTYHEKLGHHPLRETFAGENIQ